MKAPCIMTDSYKKVAVLKREQGIAYPRDPITLPPVTEGLMKTAF